MTKASEKGRQLGRKPTHEAIKAIIEECTKCVGTWDREWFNNSLEGQESLRGGCGKEVADQKIFQTKGTARHKGANSLPG